MNPDTASDAHSETASDRHFEDQDFEQLLSAATGQPVRAGRSSSTVIGKILWSLAALPIISLVLIGSMALRVRLADDAWPVRNQPDPKELGFHNTLTVLAVVASFAAVLIVPLAALVARILGQERTPVRPPVLAIVGFILLMFVIRADPGGIGTWLAD